MSMFGMKGIHFVKCVMAQLGPDTSWARLNVVKPFYCCRSWNDLFVSFYNS